MTTDNLPEPTAGDDDVSAELIAASLRADTADLEVYARVLSSNLIETLPPGAVRLERKRSLADRAAGREGRVESVDVTLGEQRMTLRLAKHGPIGEVCFVRELTAWRVFAGHDPETEPFDDSAVHRPVGAKGASHRPLSGGPFRSLARPARTLRQPLAQDARRPGTFRRIHRPARLCDVDGRLACRHRRRRRSTKVK